MISNRYNRLFSEFLHHPFVMMEPLRFNAAYQLVTANERAGIALEFSPKTLSSILLNDGSRIDCTSADDVRNTLSSLDANASQSQSDPSEGNQSNASSSDALINMICIEGTMTRGGDACTYGSKDHRVMMMAAADDPRVHGHILHINSGGGASGTLMDYRDAINYCLERGQNVVAVVDECAASAACFTAAMTNRIFVTRETDEVGSLGMYAFFPTLADGTVNPMTNEVLHIRYAPQSTDKNLAFRKAAEGDMSMIDQELHDALAVVLADVKADRTSLLDSQLTGKMYPARDVMGSMVDEIGDIDTACAWLLADWDARQGAALMPKVGAADASVNDTDDDSKKKHCNNASAQAEENNNPKQTQPVMKTYSAIPAAIGEEPMETIDGELTLQPEQADALEAHLASGINRAAMLQTKLDELQSRFDAQAAEQAAAIESLNASHAEALAAKDAEHAAAIESLNAANAEALTAKDAEHAAAIESLNASHAEAIAAKDAEHAAALAERDATIAQANETIASRDQRIADLSAEVESLNAQPNPQPQSGAQPSSNGSQAPAAPRIVVSSQYKPGMTAAEYADAVRGHRGY